MALSRSKKRREGVGRKVEKGRKEVRSINFGQGRKTPGKFEGGGKGRVTFFFTV